MGVGARDQSHVLDAQVHLLERALELTHRSRLVHAGVDQHDPVAGSDRPRIAVRDAGPRKWQAKSPQARQDTLSASKLASRTQGQAQSHTA
jgi:hypothetical protein